MNIWTQQQKKTISDHCRDFTADTYTAYMKKAGGYDAYVKALGFAIPTGTCKKLSAFRQACGAMTGNMAVWGIDYSSSNDGSGHYYRWGNGSSDAFRRTGKGKCKGGTLKAILNDPAVVTTNCNYGVNTLLRALGLYKTASENFITWATRYGHPVTAKKDLRPGDMVHFFNQPVRDRAKPSTWKGKGWKHIAIVYAVENGKIWLVDFGSRFIKSKNPLHYMPVDTSSLAGGEYTGYWTAVHAFDLEDDTVREKTTEDIAVELKRAMEAWNAVKRKEYGEEVYSMAQGYMINRDAYLRAAADYVLDEFAGKGEARKAFFGDDYDDVQAKVMWVIQAAKDVVAGKYGNDEERSAKLCADWQGVQNEVNRMKKRGEF